MTPVEEQLRHLLADHAPQAVDTGAWADAARRRAGRNRMRRTVTVAMSLALVVAAALAGLEYRETHRPPVPTRTSDAGATYSQLCSSGTLQARPLFDEGRASSRYVLAALCPQRPSDPAWAELPVPALLRDRYLDLLVRASGPPVENCEGGEPTLPAFTTILRDRNGDPVSSTDGFDRCLGAQFVQSFLTALAQQRYDDTHGPEAPCQGIATLPLDLPPRPRSVSVAVDVCVTADPSVEAEPAPVRFRPVRAWAPPGAASGTMLDGLARATSVDGRYVDCPWRHAMVRLVTTSGGGARTATVLMCQQAYPGGDVSSAERLATMRGSWPVLPGAAQALLEQQVAAYLDGRPPR